APTGIAALNCRGQTIHSFFGFPPRIINLRAIRKTKNRIYKNIDTLVIDEISMVRADLLDGVERFLRLNGRSESLPFGGTQIVFVGDLFQLPPVVTEEEADTYRGFYESEYFFSANSFNRESFEIVELKKIFRQKEERFIDFLNKIRIGQTDSSVLQLINDRVIEPSFDKRGHIILCAVNSVANGINLERLSEINKPMFIYKAETEGDFPAENRTAPVDLELKLKIGARVLFVKNDKERRWVNGTLGTVFKLADDLIMVKIDGVSEIVEVEMEEWNNIRYEFDKKTGEINEKIIGTLRQFPLRLAWAITIHRSQGMSLEKVCLDFSRSPFAHGQTYVALSRCRSLGGLVLTQKLWQSDILIDPRIVEFHRRLLGNS
ncbi:MAG: AAA family ATPase, partial [bacterium]|nr:AAA family ATPase [bacterium]